MSVLTACMGGWCLRRDHCANHNTDQRIGAVERLCERGHDGLAMERVVFRRPADARELAALRREEIPA